MPFSCLDFIGAVLPDSSAGESWEADEPTLVNGFEPCVDRWCSQGHVIVVNECRYGSDCDAVGPIKCLVVHGFPDAVGSVRFLTGVPPLNCAWGWCCAMDVYHV